MAGIERKGQQLGSIRVDVVPADADLSSLLKADLVEMATAAELDTDGLTKAELVKALEKSREG